MIGVASFRLRLRLRSRVRPAAKHVRSRGATLFEARHVAWLAVVMCFAVGSFQLGFSWFSMGSVAR